MKMWKLDKKFKSQNKEPVSELSDSASFEITEECRIKHEFPHATSMSVGFPIVDKRINLVKGMKAQVIGFDFPDKNVRKNVKESYEKYAIEMNRFWESQSALPIKMEWNWSLNWIRLPNPVKTYDLGGAFHANGFREEKYFPLIKDMISIADETVDFSGANLILIVLPPNTMNLNEVGTSLVHTQGTYKTNEGNVYNLMFAGGNQVVDDHWFRHEFGHALGLTDIRDATDLANQKSGGMYYDVMNNNRYEELWVWHRFLLGILNESQMRCIDSKSQRISTHWLTPISSEKSNLKGLVIPISNTEGIIVESRRALGYDWRLLYDESLVGAVVYTLDTKVPYRTSPVKVIKVLKIGDSINYNGFRFSVIESGNYGDVVRVEKVL